MGIHHDARLMEDISPNYIGSLSSHSVQSGQLLNALRHFPSVPLNDLARGSNDVFRFILIKSCGINISLKFPDICPGECL